MEKEKKGERKNAFFSSSRHFHFGDHAHVFFLSAKNTKKSIQNRTYFQESELLVPGNMFFVYSLCNSIFLKISVKFKRNFYNIGFNRGNYTIFRPLFEKI